MPLSRFEEAVNQKEPLSQIATALADSDFPQKTSPLYPVATSILLSGLLTTFAGQHEVQLSVMCGDHSLRATLYNPQNSIRYTGNMYVFGRNNVGSTLPWSFASSGGDESTRGISYSWGNLAHALGGIMLDSQSMSTVKAEITVGESKVSVIIANGQITVHESGTPAQHTHPSRIVGTLMRAVR